jgi:hypothetical protein
MDAPSNPNELYHPINENLVGAKPRDLGVTRLFSTAHNISPVWLKHWNCGVILPSVAFPTSRLTNDPAKRLDSLSHC